MDVLMDFQVAEGFATFAANFTRIAGKSELVENVRLNLMLRSKAFPAVIALELLVLASFLMREFLVNCRKFLVATSARISQVRKQLWMFVFHMLKELAEAARSVKLAVVNAAVDRRRMHQQNVRQAIVFVEEPNWAMRALPHSFVHCIVSITNGNFIKSRAKLR